MKKNLSLFELKKFSQINKKKGKKIILAHGTFDILHNYTKEPINDLCQSLVPTDFEIASPVKVKYDPQLLQNINK